MIYILFKFTYCCNKWLYSHLCFLLSFDATTLFHFLSIFYAMYLNKTGQQALPIPRCNIVSSHRFLSCLSQDATLSWATASYLAYPKMQHCLGPPFLISPLSLSSITREPQNFMKLYIHTKIQPLRGQILTTSRKWTNEHKNFWEMKMFSLLRRQYNTIYNYIIYLYIYKPVHSFFDKLQLFLQNITFYPFFLFFYIYNIP